MTDEHKTLDDFPFSEIIKNDLKREAIKQVKTIRSDKWDTIYYSNPLFIDFFNITEEDLK